MIIIQQLFEFIAHRREVKDVNYSQGAAVVSIIIDSLPILLASYVINQNPVKIDSVTIHHVPIGLSVTYSLAFIGFFFCLFAAQQRQYRFVQAATAFFGASAILTMINILIAPLPGAGILGLIIFALKISCAVRVMTESLDYSIPRAVFSIIGIAFMAMFIATLLFRPEISSAELIG